MYLQQLNWTPRPFKGDVQLNWRYLFPNGTPPGMLPCLTAVCYRASQDHSYQYCWSHGVLVRIGEVSDSDCFSWELHVTQCSENVVI